MDCSKEPHSHNLCDAICGAFDEHILGDTRVLERLLVNERRYIPSTTSSVLKSVQSEVRPEMRKILSSWMLEVCEELKCEQIVHSLAINYVDRFLALTDIKKSQLQLLGAVSLLIASKVRQCHAIHPRALVYYSDYSFTIEEIIDWELLVLSKLEWDMSAVVAIDFVDHLLVRLTSIARHSKSDQQLLETIKRHTSTFIGLCSTEISFSSYAPSVLATSCLATAINGLKWPNKPWNTLTQLVSLLEQITGIDSSLIHCIVEKIEDLLSVHSQLLFKQKLSAQPASESNNLLVSKFAATQTIVNQTVAKSVILNVNSGQPETPTDVQDINF